MPTKKWDKADKATLSRLIKDRDVDIYDTSTVTTNIDRVIKPNQAPPQTEDEVAGAWAALLKGAAV